MAREAAAPTRRFYSISGYLERANTQKFLDSMHMWINKFTVFFEDSPRRFFDV